MEKLLLVSLGGPCGTSYSAFISAKLLITVFRYFILLSDFSKTANSKALVDDHLISLYSLYCFKLFLLYIPWYCRLPVPLRYVFVYRSLPSNILLQ